MYSFVLSLIALIVGYFTYGLIVEKIFKVDWKRPTPAVTQEDGVDFVPLPPLKIFMIQLLNIAGLGPIFGAIGGALFGPSAFLWIVLGTIFAGGTHDFMSGMMSLRHGGKSISEVVGYYLGEKMRKAMVIFSTILLVLIGVVFTTGSAGLLASFGDKYSIFNDTILSSKTFWVVVVFVYFFLATIIAIDKIIGKVYPFFGLCLFLMAVGIGGMLIYHGAPIPEITQSADITHPKGLPIFPMLFITIACGAISGFHATQSPMMARCIQTEKYGRAVFYGAMVAEGVIALVWAAASMSFFGGVEGLLNAGTPAIVVNKVSIGLMGTFGAILAVFGVIIAPITSGDTAFRSARLTIADCFHYSQKPIMNRLFIAVPLFATGIALTFIDFDIIWRYFAWTNQTLATIVLWTGAVCLYRQGSCHWICTIPGTFMTCVCTSYILIAPEGLNLRLAWNGNGYWISVAIGIVVAVAVLGVFLRYVYKKRD